MNQPDLTESISRWQRWLSSEAYAGAGLTPDHPPVDPLAALVANDHAVELLHARRWWAVASARSAGYTWAQIAEALGDSPEATRRRYTGDLTGSSPTALAS